MFCLGVLKERVTWLTFEKTQCQCLILYQYGWALEFPYSNICRTNGPGNFLITKNVWLIREAAKKGFFLVAGPLRGGGGLNGGATKDKRTFFLFKEKSYYRKELFCGFPYKRKKIFNYLTELIFLPCNPQFYVQSSF